MQHNEEIDIDEEICESEEEWTRTTKCDDFLRVRLYQYGDFWRVEATGATDDFRRDWRDYKVARESYDYWVETLESFGDAKDEEAQE